VVGGGVRTRSSRVANILDARQTLERHFCIPDHQSIGGNAMDRFIDEQIRKAIEAGEFDDLPGKGKPIDLSTYFATPEDLRMAYSILKSNNFVPEEVEILKEIDELKRRLESCSDDNERLKIKKEITGKNYALNMLTEKRRR
jgi:hypothetical protein